MHKELHVHYLIYGTFTVSEVNFELGTSGTLTVLVTMLNEPPRTYLTVNEFRFYICISMYFSHSEFRMSSLLVNPTNLFLVIEVTGIVLAGDSK